MAPICLLASQLHNLSGAKRVASISKLLYLLTDGEVTLKEYEASVSGCIQSVAERFQEDTTLDALMLDMWNADKQFWPLE